jgi:hypothetical protein
MTINITDLHTIPVQGGSQNKSTILAVDQTTIPGSTRSHDQRRSRRLKGKTKAQKRINNSKQNKLNNVLAHNIVVNYSTHILSKDEVFLLNRGLGFVPTSRGPAITKHNEQLARFENTLQNFYFFSKQGKADSVYVKQPFTGRSRWRPPNSNPNISRFVRELNIKLLDTRKSKLKYNINKKEQIALLNLKNNNSIIIKKADKGGCIVVMDRYDYITKAETMLSDANTYMTIDSDKTGETKRLADDLILTLLLNKSVITFKQYKYLTEFSVRCPVFYGLPKIHKNNWPLRPIVSQINGPLSKLNEVVDAYLHPCVEYIPELLRDTTMFLERLMGHKNLPVTYPNLLLVTIDVTALYTNIPHEEGATWVAEFFEETYHKWKHEHKELPFISKQTMHTLMLFILQNNIFSFNNQYYKQLMGTTMGAQFSVNYANIYMHMFFRKFFCNYKIDIPPAFGRFVDDIFLGWILGPESFTSFVNALNSFHNTIKFEVESSATSVHFLDTVVYLENNKLNTTVYTKPTDKKQYLAFNSAHPAHIKTAIPYSQALRFKRIISDDTMLTKELNILKHNFLIRGYPSRLIDSSFDRLHNVERQSLLQYQSKSVKENRFKLFLKGRPFLPLIVTYFGQYDEKDRNNIRQLLTTLWEDFINSDTQVRDSFNNAFPQIIFKRGNTVGQSIIRSALPLTELTTEDWELVKLLRSNL